MLTFLLIGLVFASFIGTYLVKRVAIKKKILDIPSDRSSHLVPTPRGGGLAIVLAWYIGISFLLYLNLIEKELYYALISGVMLAIISLIDDLIGLNILLRFLVQILSATLAIMILYGFEPIYIPGFSIHPIVLYPVVIFGIVWFINLFNFMDGIDGYASLEALFIAAGVFIFIHDAILLVLISTILGFLYWNFPKAKIFMGDVGSTQLGFVLIILGLYYFKTNEFNIIYWLMLSSLFWFDATLTLIRRLVYREKLSTAHKKHAYQRIVQAGFSHLKTDILALSINTVILSNVLISYYYKALVIPGFSLILLILCGITKYIDRKYPFKTSQNTG